LNLLLTPLISIHTGIANTDRYHTDFTVASSVDFDVLMYAEGLNMLGSDNTANQLDIENVGYILETNGTGAANGGNYTFQNDAGDGTLSTITELSATTTNAIITGVAGSSAGNVAQNAFIVNWELATGALRGVTGLGTLLAQSIAPDRYTTNVFLVLQPQ
jgi:hypothetical protein